MTSSDLLHSPRRGWLRHVLAAAACGFALATASAADPIPVRDFFRTAAIDFPQLSPSGKYLAAVVQAGESKRLGLVIIDLDDVKKSRYRAGFEDRDVIAAQWLTDDRLLFHVTDINATMFDARRSGGAFVVDRDGDTRPRAVKLHISGATGIVGPMADGSGDLLASDAVYDGHEQLDYVAMYRVNVDGPTPRPHVLTAGAPAHVTGWGLDASGAPRIAVATEGTRRRVYAKATPEAPWKLLSESDIYDSELGDITVGAGNIAYATQRRAGEDTSSLVSFPLDKGPDAATPLVALKGYDFSGRVVHDPAGRLLGVDYVTDAAGTQWFDPVLKKAQERVDALLPDTINSLRCGRCANPRRVIVVSYSDRQPGIFRLYDIEHDTLTEIASTHPWIQPERMAGSDLVTLTTRDGMAMPVHVTRPRVPGPWPAVVLVHGGPYVRGSVWGWHPDAQFLASRGYLVVEPEFRGSTGFGDKWFRAGWKQWGLAMQDDIADATLWAAKKGGADGKRICIAGASYGGYATLMGLARYPELYRCGIDWVGVTDLDLLFDINWSDASDEWKLYGAPRLVGDPKADAKRFRETSPLQLADRIKRPLLMAYGSEDRRVPFPHGTKMRDALKDVNPDVEWITYLGEGHGWRLEANQVDFWTHVEAFLAKYDGPPKP